MKNDAFDKFTREINFYPTKSFANSQVKKARLNEDKIFELVIENEQIIPFSEMKPFLDAVNTNFPYKTKLHFEVEFPVYNETNTRDYLDWIVCDFLSFKHLKPIIKEAVLDFGESHKLKMEIASLYTFQEVNKIKEQVCQIMNKFGFANLQMVLVLKERGLEKIQEEERLQLKNARQEFKDLQEKQKEELGSGYGNTYKKLKIKELAEAHERNVIVEGEVFKTKVTQTKTNYYIVELCVTDYQEAILLKKILRNENELKTFEKLEKKAFVKAFGTYEYDSFKRQNVISLKTIEKIANPEAQNGEKNVTKPRVELNCHTKMSAMDGLIEPRDLIKRAQEWNHSAVTVMDTDSLQAFPDFYNASVKSDIKPIYGMCTSTLEKDAKLIFNPRKDRVLTDDKYVVFDLETTQLSPINGEIIEFGAVKIENGKTTGSKQFFVKNTKPLSQFTKGFTNITEENLEGAMTEKEALHEMLRYFEDYTLVAHNASFDVAFINEKLDQNGLPLLKNPVVDSLKIARLVHPWKKSFKLESVAKRLGIIYEAEVAHRADYDARVLANVWNKFIVCLQDKKITSHEQLQSYDSLELRQKAFKHKVSLIAKNQRGLKELFKICTKAHVENYANGAFYYFEDLANRKDVLLGSGALESRLVNKMFFGTKRDVIQEIGYYDYIEVQPLQNFKHFVGEDVSWDFIKKMLTFVIEESVKQGKMVVATGDVRYLDAKDKIKHEIYINTKGLGGSRHYLYNFKNKESVYPDQHLLTTKEMTRQFEFVKDTKLREEIVVHNPHKIAEIVDADIEVIKGDLHTPLFKDANENLNQTVYQNAKNRYGEKLPGIVERRLQKELEPIIHHGFAVIYWISHLLVKKSTEDGYLVGSRGSVGSSLVATMAGISEVNPLCPHYYCSKCQFSEFFEKSELNSGFDLPDKKCPNCQTVLNKDGQNIPFETFLGINANKVPDIDLNFSGDYQNIIHDEVKKLFGKEHTFRAGTISTVAEKTAFGYVKGWMEEKNQEISHLFMEYLAGGLVGTKRTTGQHPGGIIVIPKQFDVEEFTPVNFPANDTSSTWKTTHFDFHAIHDTVLKLDLLGHDDPTAIRMLEKLTNVRAEDIPFSDQKVISIFSSPAALGIKPEDINGEPTGAMGIPEFGTLFVRKMLKTAKVTNFGDLISVSGLSHGTNVWGTNAEILIKKQGKKLNEVISCRDDIMVDLMAKNINQLNAFQIMEKVRKGQGLNIEDETILDDHGVKTWYVESLKKIKYMFPKAHATAYVMMAWRVAWFKVYYPLEYYATYFTTRADVSDISVICAGRARVKETLGNFLSRRFVRGEKALTNKEQLLIPILEIVNEALSRKIEITNIDIDRSLAHEWLVDKKANKLVPPFSTVDGLGEAAALSIIKARTEQKFISKEDFEKRTTVNKTIVKKLSEMGIFANLHDTNQMEFKLF